MQTKNLSLPSRSRSCMHRGEAFGAGEHYVSYLENENEEMSREDFCLRCWEETREKKKGIFCRGRVAEKKDPKRTPDEKALAHFRSLIEEEPAPDRDKALFILAFYLERKGGLVRCRHTRGSSDLMIYEIPETGETYSIKSVFIFPSEGEKIIARLNEIIS